jgi:hypothetical protein
LTIRNQSGRIRANISRGERPAHDRAARQLIGADIGRPVAELVARLAVHIVNQLGKGQLDMSAVVA